VRVAAEEEKDERRSLPGSPKWTSKMNPGKAPNGRYAKQVHESNVMNLFGLVHRVNQEGESLYFISISLYFTSISLHVTLKSLGLPLFTSICLYFRDEFDGI